MGKCRGQKGWMLSQVLSRLSPVRVTVGLGGRELAAPELRHRRHARVEDRIRAAKDTGLRNLPFHDAAANQVWLEIAMLAVAQRPHRIPSALIVSITVAVVAARGIRDLHVRHTFVPGRPEPADLPS